MLKQLFASGSVITIYGEYLPRLRFGEYAPVSLRLGRIIVKYEFYYKHY
jgi:hypothetical protein